MTPHHPGIRHGWDAIFWQNWHFSMIMEKTKAHRSDVWPTENKDIRCCSDVCMLPFLKDRRIGIILKISKKKWKRATWLSVSRASHCFQHRLIFWMGSHAGLSIKPSWNCNVTSALSTAGECWKFFLSAKEMEVTSLTFIMSAVSNFLWRTENNNYFVNGVTRGCLSCT